MHSVCFESIYGMYVCLCKPFLSLLRFPFFSAHLFGFGLVVRSLACECIRFSFFWHFNTYFLLVKMCTWDSLKGVIIISVECYTHNSLSFAFVYVNVCVCKFPCAHAPCIKFSISCLEIFLRHIKGMMQIFCVFDIHEKKSHGKREEDRISDHLSKELFVSLFP